MRTRTEHWMKMDIRRLAAAGTAALAVVSSGAARAQESGPYYIGGMLSYTHLSNALGLADGGGVTPTLEQLGYRSKSDNVTSIALIGGIDQPISRQRLFGDVTLRTNRYSRNELLDNNSYSVKAGLDWQTIERISGNVTLRSTRDLVTFGTFDPLTDGKNLVTTRQADANARIGVVTRWTFEAAGGYRSIDYSNASYDPRDYRQHFGSLGARYWPSSESYVGLAWRETDGRYPHFRTSTGGDVTPDRFDRRDIDLIGFLRFSAASSINARISHTDLDYELQRDFSGVTGFLRGVWEPRAALKLTLTLARDRGEDIQIEERVGPIVIAQVQAARVASVASLRGDVALTAKTALNASARHSRRAITQTVLGATESGDERSTQFSIGATWAPTRTSLVGCDISRDRRRSDVLADRFNVTSNTAGCYGQLSLQP
jgi:hypothetical protein